MNISFIEALHHAGLLPVVFQFMTTIVVSMCSFFLYRLFNEFDMLKEEHKKLVTRCPAVHSRADLDLAQFKIQVSNEYAKTETVSRVHKRLDDLFSLLLELKETRK